MLLFDPRLVGGRSKGEKPFAAYARDGVCGDEREQGLPLEGGCVEMRGRGRDGLKKGIQLGHDFVMVAPSGRGLPVRY